MKKESQLRLKLSMCGRCHGFQSASTLPLFSASTRYSHIMFVGYK